VTAQPGTRPRTRPADPDDELDALREIREMMRRGFLRPLPVAPRLSGF
jgi:hypothetical protein